MDEDEVDTADFMRPVGTVMGLIAAFEYLEYLNEKEWRYAS